MYKFLFIEKNHLNYVRFFKFSYTSPTKIEKHILKSPPIVQEIITSKKQIRRWIKDENTIKLDLDEDLNLRVYWLDGAKYADRSNFEKVVCPICHKKFFYLKSHIVLLHKEDYKKYQFEESNWVKNVLDRAHKTLKNSSFLKKGTSLILKEDLISDNIITIEEIKGNIVILSNNQTIDQQELGRIYYKLVDCQ